MAIEPQIYVDLGRTSHIRYSESFYCMMKTIAVLESKAAFEPRNDFEAIPALMTCAHLPFLCADITRPDIYTDCSDGEYYDKCVCWSVSIPVFVVI